VLTLPQNAGVAARSLYRTVDAIWWGIGDASTDFSFYTTRAMLAGVIVGEWLFLSSLRR
jgi:ubiquinone biosynthesis protein COQ9